MRVIVNSERDITYNSVVSGLEGKSSLDLLTLPHFTIGLHQVLYMFPNSNVHFSKLERSRIRFSDRMFLL